MPDLKDSKLGEEHIVTIPLYPKTAEGADVIDEKRNPFSKLPPLKEGLQRAVPLQRYEGFRVIPSELLKDIEKLVREPGLLLPEDEAKEFKQQTGLKITDPDEFMEQVMRASVYVPNVNPANPDVVEDNYKRAAFLYAVKDNLVQKKILLNRQKLAAERFEKDKNPTNVDVEEYSQQLFAERSTPEAEFIPPALLREPLSHNHPLSRNEGVKLRDSIQGIRADQEANNLRINSLLKSQIIEEPEVKTGAKVALLSGTGLIVSDVLEPAVGKLLDLTEYLGRGVISSTVAEKSDDWAAYQKYRDQSLASRMYNLHPDKASPFHKELLSLRQNQPLYLNQAEFDKIVDLLEISDSDENRVHKERLKALNAALEKSALDFLGDESKGLKGHLNKDDAAWKYRVFQMVLLCSPFAPFSLFGPLLGWLEPLVHGASGFSGFISSFATNNFHPLGLPVGQIAEFFHINDVIKTLFEYGPGAPVAEVMNYHAETGILQPLLQATVPLIMGPIGSLAAAGAMSVFRGATELELMSEIDDIRKSGKKSMDKVFADHDKNAKEKVEIAIGNYVTKKLALGEKGFAAGQMADFLARHSSLIQYATNNLELRTHLQELIDGRNVKLAMEILNNPQLLERILVLKTTLELETRNGPVPQENYAALFSNDDKKPSTKDLSEARQTLIDDFYFAEARKFNLNYSAQDTGLTGAERTAGADAIKIKITRMEIDRMVRNEALQIGMDLSEPSETKEEKKEENPPVPLEPAIEDVAEAVESIKTNNPPVVPPADAPALMMDLKNPISSDAGADDTILIIPKPAERKLAISHYNSDLPGNNKDYRADELVRNSEPHSHALDAKVPTTPAKLIPALIPQPQADIHFKDIKADKLEPEKGDFRGVENKREQSNANLSQQGVHKPDPSLLQPVIADQLENLRKGTADLKRRETGNTGSKDDGHKHAKKVLQQKVTDRNNGGVTT